MSQEHKDVPKPQVQNIPSLETLEKMRSGEIPMNIDDIVAEAQRSLTSFRDYLSTLDPEMYPTVVNNIASGMIEVANAFPDRKIRFAGYSAFAVYLAIDGRTTAEIAKDSYNIYRASLTEAKGLENLGRHQEAQQAYIIADENLLRTPTPMSIQEAKLAYGQSRMEINNIRLGIAQNHNVTDTIKRVEEHIAAIGSRNSKDDLAAKMLAIDAKLAFADSLIPAYPDVARRILTDIEWEMSQNPDLQEYGHRFAFVAAKAGKTPPGQ